MTLHLIHALYGKVERARSQVIIIGNYGPFGMSLPLWHHTTCIAAILSQSVGCRCSILLLPILKHLSIRIKFLLLHCWINIYCVSMSFRIAILIRGETLNVLDYLLIFICNKLAREHWLALVLVDDADLPHVEVWIRSVDETRRSTQCHAAGQVPL